MSLMNMALLIQRRVVRDVVVSSYAYIAWTIGKFDIFPSCESKGMASTVIPSTTVSIYACLLTQLVSACESIPNLVPKDISSEVRGELKDLSSGVNATCEIVRWVRNTHVFHKKDR